MKKSLLKNALYKITLNFFNLILPIIIGPYVYRTLGADAIGSVKFGESIFNYFFIFATFGIYQYGLREISRIKHDKEKTSQVFTSLFTFSLFTNVIAFLAFLAVGYLGYGGGHLFPILLIFSVNLILNVFFVEWINEAFEDYNFITIKTILVKVVYVVLLFTFVNGTDDYLTFVWLLVINSLLNNVISFIYVKRRIKFSFKDISILPHIKPLFLVVIFSNGNILYTQLDRFMIGQFVSERSVSFYAMSQQIMTIINALMLSIIQVTIPRLSFLLGTEDDTNYISLLNRISKVYFALLFPASIGLFVISDIGVVVYGGAEFAPAGPVLAFFSIYMITLGIESMLANQVIYMKKKEKMLVGFIFIGGVINILLNLLLVWMDILSPENAIMTTTISNVVLVSIEYWYIRRVLRVPFHLFTLPNMKYLLYSLLFIPVSYGIRMLVTETFTLFFVLVIVNALLYFVILVVTKDEIFTLLVSKIKAKIKR
ncbi:oligosaccharide flippase family protein [Bacillus tianshenii]|uniref:oligosaccharide flippase family protein n=1 Tax=Sutcliffiella tianshenii TaxID=1463404 RepID=UPI001CD2D5A5|nr:oligosaccharide flippase family protein [Bacillus tianshenii]MCA1320484.1 oligosaccharide flippase family protein [Bacillus tianshenii]